MLKANTKLLIYDLLELIDNDNFESSENIKQLLSTGKLIPYLVSKYNMSCFSKTDTQEISIMLRDRIGCHEINFKNGLIWLIEVLLDCE